MKAQQQEKQHSNLKKRGKEKSKQLVVYFSSLMDCSQPLYFFFSVRLLRVSATGCHLNQVKLEDDNLIYLGGRGH